jgi:hypothetical protein
MSIPEDEDGLIMFVVTTITEKKEHYDRIIEEYSRDRYPQKEVVLSARDLMNDILSQKRDNVALLTRLVQKQDDLRNITEDMEEIETFFKTQRPIYDSSRKLQKDLQNERDYFATDTETNAKIMEISAILGAAKPYDKIKDLPGLMQDVKKAYNVLLEQKKEEVLDIITQCMGDVHTLAGVGSNATDEVRKADDRFTEYKQKVVSAESLTVLDAMITQLLNFKDHVCKRIENILQTPPEETNPGVIPKPKKIIQVRRYDVFPVKRLTSKEDVDNYLGSIRKKLYEALESNDGIQIS